MSDYGIFDIQGTDPQKTITKAILERSTFPFSLLCPGLQAQTGRTSIPIDWQNCDAIAARPRKAGVDDGHTHDHGHAGQVGFHPIERRERILGLAWYSGRVTLDLSLESDPELAGEVFMSEGAHMADFFYMTDDMRRQVYNIFHTTDQHIPEGTAIDDSVDYGHGHGWFDVGGYYSWVGEAFMGIFTVTFSDFPVTINFDHPVPPDAEPKLRSALLPQSYFGTKKGWTFHDSHKGVRQDLHWPTRSAAIDAGRQPCRTCKP